MKSKRKNNNEDYMISSHYCFYKSRINEMQILH